MIQEETKIGEGCLIYYSDLSNIGRCTIGKHCNIHAGVHIHDGVKIGDYCKIQAQVFIPNGVEIGNEVFIGPGVVFTNDKHPKVATEWKMEITKVGNKANIGANATILPGIKIGEGATIGAGSVITKDVPAGETWIGNPGRKL